MKIKINELEIDIDPGVTLEISPDGKNIQISAPREPLPSWQAPLIIREIPAPQPWQPTITWQSTPNY